MADPQLDYPEQWSDRTAPDPSPAPAEGPTPEWWRDRLLKQFVENDLPYRTEAWDIYNARQPYPTQNRKYAEVYDRLKRAARTPWGRMVVDVTAERLTMQGFQLGDGTADEELGRIVKAARADAFQRTVHRDAGAAGTGYVSVWNLGGKPSVSVESSLQCAHERKAGSMTEVAAAVKVWIDSVAGEWRCDLYTETHVFRWRSRWTSRMTNVPKGKAWEWLPAGSVIEHKLPMVPLVPFVQRPDYNGYGTSELKDLAPIFDRIELLTTDLLLASNYGAFKQRWATGIEIPIDPTTGEEVEPYRAAVDRIWISESPETRFGAIDSTELTPMVRAIGNEIATVSAIARIPSNYFIQSELANPPSAASQEAGEVNLIGKVEGLQRTYGESWDRVGDLCMAILGRGDEPGQLSTVWKDPRRRSEAQILDAATKLALLPGMPFQPVLEFIGYGPDEVREIMAMRATDVIANLAAQLRTPQVADRTGQDQGTPTV